MDLEILFVFLYANIYNIFHYVIEHQINNDDAILIDFYINLTDIDTLKAVAKEFASNYCNKSNISREITDLDGQLVKIKCPTVKRDNVKN